VGVNASLTASLHKMLLEQSENQTPASTETGHGYSFSLGRGFSTLSKIKNSTPWLPTGWGLSDGRYISGAVEDDLVIFHDRGISCVVCTVSRQDKMTGDFTTIGLVDFRSMPNNGTTVIRGFNSAVGDNNSMVYVRLV
jgi:hypothetical protein